MGARGVRSWRSHVALLLALVIGEAGLMVGLRTPAYADTGWSRQTPTTSPSPRKAGPLAYAKDGMSFLFGGENATSALNDTWVWDGRRGTWTQLATSTSPPAEGWQFGMAYDSVRDVVVLFGVRPNLAVATWELISGDWVQRSSAHQPPNRRGGVSNALVYDPNLRRTILFSGQDQTGAGDTWEWDGQDWTQVSIGSGPARRWDHCMTYDAARRATLVYGGWEDLDGSPNPLRDTWAFDGTTWTRLLPGDPFSSPDPVCSLAYDAKLGLTYGFEYRGGSIRSFVFDGSMWSLLAVANPPTARGPAVYDVEDDTILAFVGDRTGGYVSETWYFNPPPVQGPNRPVVSAVTPNVGTVGTDVTISGSGFTGALVVNFGSGTPLGRCADQPIEPCFTVVDDSTIRAQTPSRPTGAQHTVVANRDGLSQLTAADFFHFEGWYFPPTPPSGTAFDPPAGLTDTFTVIAYESVPIRIDHTAAQSVSCQDIRNPGQPAEVRCTVQHLVAGPELVRFYDATQTGHIPDLLYYAGGHGAYVAMGDSFSSGEGVPPFYTGTDTLLNRCHASTSAYGQLVAAARFGGQVHFMACSGALIKEVYFGKSFQQGLPDTPSQLPALNSDTQLATLSVGGNDMGFADLASTCLAVHSGCQYLLDSGVRAKIVRFGAAGTEPPLSESDRNRDPTDPIFTLDRIYAAIRNRAQAARLIVLGYPRLLINPPPAQCSLLDFPPLGLDHDEMVWINDVVNQLDTTIAMSAARVGAESVVGAVDGFNGHEECTADPWANAVILEHREYSAHPNAAGQLKFSQEILDRFGGGGGGGAGGRASGLSSFDVAAGQAQVSFSIGSSESGLIGTVVSPSGRRIATGAQAPDITDYRGPDVEVISVAKPEAGTWTVEVASADGVRAANVSISAVRVPAYHSPPLASMSPTVSGLAAHLDATASASPDGSITSYEWEFGDGSIGSGVVVDHSYAHAGAYIVKLTVTDDAGKKGFAQRTVNAG
jgi:hypothetical protein